MWTSDTFEYILSLKSTKKIRLFFKHNRSTMLAIRKVSQKEVHVFLQHFFLHAHDDVIDAIAHYIKGKPSLEHKREIQGFIQKHTELVDYSSQVNTSLLETKGKVYDLKKIYKQVNKEYFNNELNLHLTWYGERYQRHRTSITFGQYDRFLKMIKIHRVLDQKRFPDFFVHFTMYHEMLHHIVCPTIDQKGQVCYHNREFKQREKEFKHYDKAKRWEIEHRASFFNF